MGYVICFLFRPDVLVSVMPLHGSVTNVSDTRWSTSKGTAKLHINGTFCAIFIWNKAYHSYVLIHFNPFAVVRSL